MLLMPLDVGVISGDEGGNEGSADSLNRLTNKVVETLESYIIHTL
jgi:hypothetical protein